MRTKEEQIIEFMEDTIRELNKPYPNRETLHNLNLRELELIFGDDLNV